MRLGDNRNGDSTGHACTAQDILEGSVNLCLLDCARQQPYPKMPEGHEQRGTQQGDSHSNGVSIRRQAIARSQIRGHLTVYYAPPGMLLWLVRPPPRLVGGPWSMGAWPKIPPGTDESLECTLARPGAAWGITFSWE